MTAPGALRIHYVRLRATHTLCGVVRKLNTHETLNTLGVTCTGCKVVLRRLEREKGASQT